MLWNRKKDFTVEQLDIAAYKEFKVIETFAFKRNMFFVPYDEYALYRTATKGIVTVSYTHLDVYKRQQ